METSKQDHLLQDAGADVLQDGPAEEEEPGSGKARGMWFLGVEMGENLGKIAGKSKKKRVKTLDKSEKTRNNSEETRENRGKTEKPWIYGNELETDHKHTGKQHGKPDNSDSCENRG